MMFNKNIVLFLLLSFVLLDKNHAFLSGVTGVAKYHNTKQTEQNIRYSKIATARFGCVEDELEELEKARMAFERLMKSDESSFLVEFQQAAASNDGDDDELNNAPPLKKEDYVPILTESCRRRREVEMELLASLETSNDAIEQLINFWVVERDQESAMKLKEMEQFCSPGHEREERFLLDMIHEYGYHWVEPMSRLALIYYADGRSEECEHWCKVALAVKPWHFEVLQTLIMNAVKQNDKEKAKAWQKISLPPLEDTDRRKKWVEGALKDAKDSIDRAQKAKKAAIKKTEKKQKTTNVSSKNNYNIETDFLDDAWQ